MDLKLKDHFLNLLVLILWLISGVFVPIALPALADEPDWTFMSADLDGDGLSNQVEELGWCNAKGCFTTDPFDLDSDDDTLTDGEEKLFDSHPLNESSPGLYVIYDNALKTKEYYPWQPYGHKWIARADGNNSGFVPPRPDSIDVQRGLGTNLDAIVARRGSTIRLGGPIDQELQVNKSISGLTDLSPTRDLLTGEWLIEIPENGTVGKYTLSLGSESIDLFVIFQLPTPTGELTQEGIDRFVYDDTFSVIRDTWAVVLGDRRYPPYPYESPPWPGENPPYASQLDTDTNWINEGTPYGFITQHYNRFLFENYVVDAINGRTTQQSAADALTDRVDALTIFNNPRTLHNSWQVLNPGVNPRQQCSNVSGLLTAFNRAAGIPARPVMIDWRLSSFDHATEIWLNSDWRVYRGYNTQEMTSPPPGVEDPPPGDPIPPSCVSSGNWPQCGTLKDNSRSNWGRYRYRPYHSGGGGSGVAIVLADDNWTSTGLAYRWPSWITATWTAPVTPTGVVTAMGVEMNINTSKMRTKNAAYWEYYGWTQEPVNLGSPGWPPAPPSGGGAGALAALTVAGSSDDFQSSQVQLGNVVNEYGVDTNGNGRYDRLVLEVEVTAAQPGSYWLRAELVPSQFEPSLDHMGGLIATALANPNLTAGTQIVPLVFAGTEIATKRVAGPYVLNGLWITDVPDPAPDVFMNESLAYRANLHTTRTYAANNFEDYGALLSNQYTHRPVDSNGDGRVDTLTISTGIEVSQPGNYMVEANLYDSQGEFISQATWSGAGPSVTLQFGNLAGKVGPYTLQEVNLSNASGQSVDLIGSVAYTIDPLPELTMSGVVSLEVFPDGAGLSAQGTSITPTLVFTNQLVEGDLKVTAQVNVAMASSYKLEAWLADTTGNLVAWASGETTLLDIGLQELSVTFEGDHIRARGIPGPYKIVAVKVLDGSTSDYTVLDKVDEVSTLTEAYTLDQFASTYNPIFEDFVINSDQWSAQSPWAITDGIHQYFGSSKAWSASNANAILSLNPSLNLNQFTHAALKFQTSYSFNDAASGLVEVSTDDGGSWSTVATFSGSSSWSGETTIVDLSVYVGPSKPPVQLRFRLDASAGGSWRIDDVLIAGILDSDGDGLSDEYENSIGTDPENPDTDGDGMPDGWEVHHNFNPLINDANGDADGDGLTNLEEYQWGTNPHNPDSDSDGLPDGWEVDYNFNPLDDGTTDVVNGPDGDPDNDKFSNLQEYLAGTNPRNPDTDGDGIPDGIDPEPVGRQSLFLPIIIKN